MIDLSNGFTVKERIVLICGKVAVDLLSDEHSHDGGKTWGEDHGHDHDDHDHTDG